MNRKPENTLLMTFAIRRRDLRKNLLCVACVALSLSPAIGGLAVADDPEMHDDGIVEPYVAPAEHLEYVDSLDPALVPTLKAAPDMIEKWQDDRFGVFMHWDPSCQVTGAVSWSRNGPRPHHSSDGTVTKEIDRELYDKHYFSEMVRRTCQSV